MDIAWILHNNLLSKNILLLPNQQKKALKPNCSSTLFFEKQIALRFLLYPMMSFNTESFSTPKEFIFDSISFLRLLTLSNDPEYVSEFLNNKLNLSNDKTYRLCHVNFLHELYLSLGLQHTESYGHSLETLEHISDSLISHPHDLDFSIETDPHIMNENDFLGPNQICEYNVERFNRIQDSHCKPSIKQCTIPAINTDLIRERSFKRTLFDSELDYRLIYVMKLLIHYY